MLAILTILAMLTLFLEKNNSWPKKITCRNVDDIDDVDNTEKQVYVMLAILTILAMLTF